MMENGLLVFYPANDKEVRTFIDTLVDSWGEGGIPLATLKRRFKDHFGRFEPDNIPEEDAEFLPHDAIAYRIRNNKVTKRYTPPLA